MKYSGKVLLAASVALATVVGFAPAQAAVITSPASLTLINLGTGNGFGLQSSTGTTTGGLTIGFSGVGTGIYSGSASGLYTSPFAGTATPNQNYLAAQTNGSVTIDFGSAQTSFGLLFGTADNYNNLTFTTNGAGGSQSFSGADVMAAIGGTPNGTMTRNILFSGLNSFTRVTATDTQQAAFEFVPAAVASTVPEPVSLAVLGAGLVGMGMLRRRSSK